MLSGKEQLKNKQGMTGDQCNELIRQALDLARQLIILADEGERSAMDDGCRVLYGVVRDCAYKLRTEAERERDSHKAQGRWETIMI